MVSRLRYRVSNKYDFRYATSFVTDSSVCRVVAGAKRPNFSASLRQFPTPVYVRLKRARGSKTFPKVTTRRLGWPKIRALARALVPTTRRIEPRETFSNRPRPVKMLKPFDAKYNSDQTRRRRVSGRISRRGPPYSRRKHRRVGIRKVAATGSSNWPGRPGNLY